MATATVTAMRIKPSLHVEVRLKSSSGNFVRTDLVREEVTSFLVQDFISLRIGEPIHGYEQLAHGEQIASIRVVDYSGTDTDSAFHRLEDVHLDVQAYELHANEDGNSSGIRSSPPSNGNDEEDSVQLRVKTLPSKSLDGVWESLVFSDQTPGRLLRYISRMMSISRHPSLNPQLLNWNRLVLLYGPAGSGKSTLCRALSQKLAIRMGRYYSRGKLIEINANSLLSKWFGESGKLIAKVFDQIHAVADDETSFVCVLIDEVETLTGSREKAAVSSEVGDALRATNQLLTALDRLRHRRNVVVFCTSNLINALDSAFLDRVDVKQYIPNPCPQAIYEILRSCINEMIRCGLVSHDGHTDTSTSSPPSPSNTSVGFVVVNINIPNYAEMSLLFWDRPDSSARKLWNIAQKADGLSGRTLRRLPFLALAMHTFADTCSIQECLAALAIAVGEQFRVEGTVRPEPSESKSPIRSRGSASPKVVIYQ